MFSGIVEKTGKIVDIKKSGTNLDLHIETEIAKDCYIDQSIAHNGICLTVVKKDAQKYVVTAIKESIDLTNLGYLKIGDLINLERCVKANDRIDGHFVQGHVDCVAECQKIVDIDGSWYFTFKIPDMHAPMIVSKGSVCINGISLTVVEPTTNTFKVAIIPYTYENTNFHRLQKGSIVNIEFDIVGKYINRYLDLRK